MKAAVISAILEHPSAVQRKFNDVVSEYGHVIIGRMGIPCNGGAASMISLSMVAPEEEIRALSDKLSRLPDITVSHLIAD